MHGTLGTTSYADLRALADEANAQARAADECFSKSLGHAIKCGEILNKAKELVAHGDWNRWQRQNLVIKPRMARDYMQLAKLDEEKRRRVAKMPLREALKALRQRPTMQSVECYTPEKYIEAARKVLGAIVLDPASCEEANQVVKASKIFTKEQNGLTQPWHGRVWLNPPYCGEAGPFIEKLASEYQAQNVTEAIVLVNSNHDAVWFKPLFDGVLCFTDHRLKFYDRQSPRVSSVFTYLGPKPDRFAQEFAPFGAVVARWKPTNIQGATNNDH